MQNSMENMHTEVGFFFTDIERNWVGRGAGELVG